MLLSRLFKSRKGILVTTVEHETTPGGKKTPPWVVVLTTYSIVQARLALARLQDEGILSRLRQESASRAIPVDVGIIGRIDLLVPEPSGEEALKIIEETIGDLPDDGES